MHALLATMLLLSCYSPAAHALGKERFDTFRFQFVDEAERDPSFLVFRKKFLDAVGHREASELLLLMEEKTAKAFAKKWKLEGEGSRESLVWEKLRETLALGGSFEEGAFVAPYVHSKWPERYPSLDFLAVTAKKAVVREKAQENSHAVETLSMEIVGRYDELPDPPGWRAVRTPSGKFGFLKSSECRSPNDFHARFTKANGEWKLSAFSAGDANRE